MKFIFAFLFIPFICAAQKNCDTLFVAHKAAVIYSSSLDSLGFDSANVVYRFHNPAGFLYKSKLDEDDGYYRFAFSEGKKWRSWLTQVADVEFGSIQCSWKEVDGKGKPDLVIWEMHVFGHHAATHAEEWTHYTMHIWDLETATLLLRYYYKDSEWSDDADAHEENADSNSYQAPPYGTDEYSDIAISAKSISIHVLRNTHNGDQTRYIENDSGGMDTLDPALICLPAEGRYVFENGVWIRSNEPFKTNSPELHPPEYHPYWEMFYISDEPVLDFFRRIFNN